MRERILGGPCPEPRLHAPTTAARILNVLARVPACSSDERVALALVRNFHARCLVAVRLAATSSQVEAIVEPLRRELLQQLGALAEPIDGPAPMAGEAPRCPKCGQPMTGGAPHGPWPVQWECRRCGEFLIPHSGEKGGAA